LFIYAVILVGFCFRFLPESLPKEKRQVFSFPVLLRNYQTVLSSAPFHLQSGVVALNFAGLFLYIASAPVFLIQHLKLSVHEFGWQFIPMVSGIFLGSLGANRLAGKIPVCRQVQIGYIFLIGAAVANLAYHVAFHAAIPWSVMPLFFYAIGMSLVAPGVALMTLDLFPNTRGITASCQSCMLTFLAALVAGIMAPALESSPIWLGMGQLSFASCALLCWRLSQKYNNH
jgi:DHA1 family bicyclomycin/chloramphenicol resistance-like MFS transporter